VPKRGTFICRFMTRLFFSDERAVQRFCPSDREIVVSNGSVAVTFRLTIASEDLLHDSAWPFLCRTGMDPFLVKLSTLLRLSRSPLLPRSPGSFPLYFFSKRQVLSAKERVSFL